MEGTAAMTHNKRESRFHELMAAAVHEYELLQSTAEALRESPKPTCDKTRARCPDVNEFPRGLANGATSFRVDLGTRASSSMLGGSSFSRTAGPTVRTHLAATAVHTSTSLEARHEAADLGPAAAADGRGPSECRMLVSDGVPRDGASKNTCSTALPVEGLVMPRLENSFLELFQLRGQPTLLPLMLQQDEDDKTFSSAEETLRSKNSEEDGRDGQSGASTDHHAKSKLAHHKDWVYAAWQLFTVRMAESSQHYVLRECWVEAKHGHLRMASVDRSASSLSRRYRKIKSQEEEDFDDILLRADIFQATWSTFVKHPGGRALRKVCTAQPISWFDYHSSNPSRFMMHPDSVVRLLWSMAGIFFLFVDFFFSTMSVFEIVRPRGLELTDATYWTFDVLVNFRTGCHEHAEVNMNARSIGKSYMRGWFLFDFALIAYQWILAGLDSRSNVQIVRYVRFFRFAKLLRVTKLQLMFSYLVQRCEHIYIWMSMRFALYTVCLALYVHVSGTVFHIVGESEPDGWVTRYDGIFQQWPSNYVGSVMWAVTQMQGSAEVMPGNLKERIFGTMHYLMSIIVLALFISKVTTVMAAIAELKSEQASLTRVAYVFMRENKIRLDLRIMLQRFLKDKAALDKKSQASRSDVNLLSILPAALRKVLLMEVRWPVVGRTFIMQTFQRFYSSFTEQVVCDLMRHCLYSPTELVFQNGVICSSMYFLAGGVAWYLPCGSMFSRVRDDLNKSSPHILDMWQAAYWKRTAERVDEVGHTWCESSLFVRWVHLGSLQTDPYSTLSLLVLDAQMFEGLVTIMPEVRSATKDHAHRFFIALSKLARLSDTFSSENLSTICEQGKGSGKGSNRSSSPVSSGTGCPHVRGLGHDDA